MITEELITYPTAQLAKQVGFNGACFYIFKQFKEGSVYEEGYFDIETEDCYWGELYTIQDVPRDNETYLRPTQSLLQRWIREVYDIHMYPTRCKSKTKYSWVIFKDNKVLQGDKWKTYELALEQALKEALTIIISRNK